MKLQKLQKFMALFIAMFGLLGFSVNAETLSVRIKVDNPERVVMKTKAGDSSGRIVELTSGTNTYSFDTETDGPSLIITDNEEQGYVKIVNINTFTEVMPENDAYTIDLVSDLTDIHIVTDPNEPQSRVWFDANKPEQITVTYGEDNTMADIVSDPYLWVDKKTVVRIAPKEGFKITGIECNMHRVVINANEDGSYWFYANYNKINLTVRSQIDSDDNVCISVDDASAILVSTKDGRPIELKDGDNYMKLDYKEVNPLTITPAENCMIEYIACGDDMQNPYQSFYLVDLIENGFSEITITTSRDDYKFSLFIDNSDAVAAITDSGREIKLNSGNNSVVFWFDMEEYILLKPTGVFNITGVTLDGVPLEAKDDGSYKIAVTAHCKVVVTTDTPEDQKWLTIVNEDFEYFEFGSEEEPYTDWQILDVLGYVSDSSLIKPYDPSCTRTWGGGGWAMAGGALAVINGFVNTPTGDYSGPLKMTFRAKLAPGQDITETTLDVNLIRRSALIDYKRTQINLTTEWQEFEIEADNGFFRDCMFQFSHMSGNATFLLDDIKIVHRIVSIEPPMATEAFEISDERFVASWKTTPTAHEYLLSVYSKKPTDEVDVIDEGFENINADTDGKIDTENPNYPENLEFSLQDGHVANGIDSPRAIQLTKNGDYILLPKKDYVYNKLSFKMRIDGGSTANLAESVVRVSAHLEYDWYTWVTASLNGNIGDCVEADFTQYFNMYHGNIYGIKIELVSPKDSDVAIAIDDLHAEAPCPPEKEFLWIDHVLKGNEQTSCEVTDENFDPNVDYYYYVKARNDQFTSAPSNEVEVFGVNRPIALEPSDVTTTSYVANWDCGPKCDFFRLEEFRHITAATDETDVVILEEHFDKVESAGTPEDPEVGEYTTGMVKLDDYTALSGWTASSYSFANGAIGGLAKTDGYIAGSICTPEIDLSNNYGICKVKFRVYAEKGTHLVIAGSASSSAQEIFETGWYEDEIPVIQCGSKERLTFYSGEYEPFLLDYVIITQDLKAGDEISIRTKDIVINDKNARSYTVNDVAFGEDYDLGYTVTGNRYYHDETKYVHVSPRSEIMWIEKPIGDAVEEIFVNDSLRLISTEGGIEFGLSEPANVKVYGIDGLLVADVDAASGRNFINLPSAIYIMSVNGTRIKVAVK